MRVFHTVEGEEESVLPGLFRGKQIFDSEELSLADDCENTLVRVRPGEPGELVARFERYADAGGSTEINQPFEAVVSTLAGDTDMIELARTGTDGLLDRVETVKNFHTSSLPLDTADGLVRT
jgi:hypothetical protein